MALDVFHYLDTMFAYDRVKYKLINSPKSKIFVKYQNVLFFVLVF